MSIGMNRMSVASLAFVMMCVAGVGRAQKAPATGLHFEPELTELDAPGRMEAWDAAKRTLHVVPNADVKVCLPHTMKTGIHEHCLTAAAWGRLAHKTP